MAVRAADFLGVEGLKARGAVFCKWVGAAAMLFEHVCSWGFGWFTSTLPQTVGAFAFPMFVASFGALAGPRPERWYGLACRLGLLAVAAQSTGYWIGRGYQMNVIGTFALGALLAYAWHERRMWVAAAAFAFGATAEFSLAGVLAIAAALHIGANPNGGWGRYAILFLAAAMLPVWNPYGIPVVVWFASLAAAVVLFLPIDAPDRRGAFAVGYVAQWPVLYGVRELVNKFYWGY